MFYELPTSVEVGGREWPIRSDYRAALDLITVMGDAELDDSDRTLLAMEIFFDTWSEPSDGGEGVTEHGFWEIPVEDYQEAIERIYWFVGGGKGSGGRKPKLMDWEQDFQLIAAPVNRVLGYEVREVEYLHWWSFLSAYYEMGDCLFAQVVGIRKKKSRGQKLDKADQAFARENADLVNFKVRATASEEAVASEWIGG